MVIIFKGSRKTASTIWESSLACCSSPLDFHLKILEKIGDTQSKCELCEACEPLTKTCEPPTKCEPGMGTFIKWMKEILYSIKHHESWEQRWISNTFVVHADAPAMQNNTKHFHYKISIIFFTFVCTSIRRVLNIAICSRCPRPFNTSCVHFILNGEWLLTENKNKKRSHSWLAASHFVTQGISYH